MPHQHAAHEPGHAEHQHGAAEAFPRRLLASLVADDEERSRARARWQAALLAAGLAAFALAFPTRALIGDGPDCVRAIESGAWFVVHLGLAPLARIVELLPWIEVEPAWFVISAISWGVCVVACWKSLVRHGARARAALVAAVVTLGAPAAWLAATLPGGAAPGLLGAWLVFGSLLDAAREPGRVDRHGKVALAFVLAFLLDVRSLAYLPAIFAEAWWTGRESRQGLTHVVRRGIALVPALALAVGAFAVAAFVLPSAPEGWDFLGRALDGLFGRGPGGMGSLWLALFGLGMAAFGLLILALPPVDPEERRPPLWIAVWCAGPLALPVAFWSVDVKAVLCALLPPAALGLASWFGDRDWKDLVRYALLFVAGQFCVGLGFTYGITTADRNAAWRERAAEALWPGDVLLTLDGDHAYLGRHRFDLEVIDLRAPLALEGEERARWWSDLGDRLAVQIDAGARAAFDLGDRASDYACRPELLRLRTRIPYVDL